MSTAMTCAPVVANARATARPIPPAAPVTMTPLPSSPAPTLQAMASSFDALDLREDPFASIRVNDVVDDLDAQSGFRGRVHVSVDVPERLRHQLVLHRVAERLELEDLARRGADADRKTRRGRDRRPTVVGARLTPVVLDAVSDLLEAGDPLGPAGVDSDDVHRAGLEDPLVALEVPFLLAVRDEGGRLAAQVRVTLRIPGA